MPKNNQPTPKQVPPAKQHRRLLTRLTRNLKAAAVIKQATLPQEAPFKKPPVDDTHAPKAPAGQKAVPVKQITTPSRERLSFAVYALSAHKGKTTPEATGTPSASKPGHLKGTQASAGAKKQEPPKQESPKQESPSPKAPPAKTTAGADKEFRYEKATIGGQDYLLTPAPKRNPVKLIAGTALLFILLALPFTVSFLQSPNGGFSLLVFLAVWLGGHFLIKDSILLMDLVTPIGPVDYYFLLFIGYNLVLIFESFYPPLSWLALAVALIGSAILAYRTRYPFYDHVITHSTDPFNRDDYY